MYGRSNPLTITPSLTFLVKWFHKLATIVDNRAGEMRVFLRVVDAGSFSEAARLLLMTPSTVSKLIRRIESRLGVRLLERSTRRLSLTAEGKIYYERSQALLSELEEIESGLAQGSASAAGTVRVSASVGFGIAGLEPLLPAFWQTYPNIAVDLSLSDRIVDMYAERTDVAFRVGPMINSGLVALKLGTAPLKIVASPAYLVRKGTPRSVADLRSHDCLGFNFRYSAPNWPGACAIDRRTTGPLLANNCETVRRMAIAGLGLARLGEYEVRADLEAGRLVEVLSDAIIAGSEDIHALYINGEPIPRRLRIFLDFMVPRLRTFLAGTKPNQLLDGTTV